jgi:hypothetical protein
MLNILNAGAVCKVTVKAKVLGVDGRGGTEKNGYNSIITPSDDEIANASNLLKTFIYQLNGKDVDFKALIPFELEITLDGISGLVIGQIFTIDQSILPRDYYNKNLGFVITGISHILQSNDWTTTIKTQICLLENENYASNFDKDKLKSLIETIRQQNQSRAYIFYAMVDYVIYLIVRIMNDKKTPFEAGTKASINSNGLKLNNLSPTNFLGFSNLQDQLYKISNEEHPDLESLGFTGSGGTGGVKKYMEKWYNENVNRGLPNYPNNFQEFLQIILPDGTILFPADIDKFIINFDTYLLDTSKLEKDLTIKDKDGFKKNKDFFLYKFFTDDPKGFFENNEYIQTTFAEGFERNDFINLKKVYADLIKEVQTFIDTQPNFKFLIQSNEIPLMSLEVDIKEEGLYKLD